MSNAILQMLEVSDNQRTKAMIDTARDMLRRQARTAPTEWLRQGVSLERCDH